MYELAAPAQSISAGTMDTHAKSRHVALRLLSLAATCRVSVPLLHPLICIIHVSPINQTQGMSGRALRRLPVLALARYIGVGSLTVPNRSDDSSGSMRASADVDMWLDGMERVVSDLGKEKEHFV